MTALRRFAAAELDEWTGLPAGLTLDDVGAVLQLEPEPDGRGFLGTDRTPAYWTAAESERYEGGVRVWHADGAVLLIEARGPAVSAPVLGEPEATLEASLGPLILDGGERVYASRGLTLRVNPENDIVLAALGYAPTTAADYLARLRPELPLRRRLPLRRER